jgi:hypothetical protein
MELAEAEVDLLVVEAREAGCKGRTDLPKGAHGKEGVDGSSPPKGLNSSPLRVQKVICCLKRQPKMPFCRIYKRMMGFEPTAFCMAKVGERSRLFA